MAHGLKVLSGLRMRLAQNRLCKSRVGMVTASRLVDNGRLNRNYLILPERQLLR